jgi:hypothetical protein
MDKDAQLAYALKEKAKCLAAIKRLEREIEVLYEQIKVVQLEKRQNELWLMDAETTLAAPRD